VNQPVLQASQPHVFRAPRPVQPCSRLLDSNKWFELQVVARRNKTRDIVVFDLALPNGATLPAFRAGAHLEVKIGGADPPLLAL